MINQLSFTARGLAVGRILATTLLLAVFGIQASPAESANSAADPSKLPGSVGLNISSRSVNPDKSVSLVFTWNDKGQPRSRTVVANEATIVVYNGKLRRLADLSDADFKAKAVATVGADGLTVVVLRFGKSPVPKDQLTPAQAALLSSSTPMATSVSDAALEKRVAAIVGSLGLTEPAVAAQVRAVLATDLRAVRDAHNAGLQLDEAVHQKFIAGLQADLTPVQVEAVKDKLTINKLPITLKVYRQIFPNLKPEDDAFIVAELQKAREESLHEKNVDEMTPIFKKHKKEIEHYLDAHGYDWDKSYKAFVDAQKKPVAAAR
jgi:hypothetical protein